MTNVGSRTLGAPRRRGLAAAMVVMGLALVAGAGVAGAGAAGAGEASPPGERTLTDLELSRDLAVEHGGEPLRHEPPPPLLGRRSATEVEERHPSFAAKARELAAAADEKASALQAMSGTGEEIRVWVYFASWSPICERIVPKVLALEEALGGRVRFEYYGLPKPLDDDPLVREMGLTGVPTLVVERGGEEVGRLQGAELDEPAAALERLLRARP